MREALIIRLQRQARRRWLILAAALAVLFCLGIFAGHVRNPDAVKRQWAVLVSRILAGAGGFFLIRLLLFSYEERVPVLFFDLSSRTGIPGSLQRLADAVRGLRDRGYDVVTLADVVEFVRDQRYVPPRCFGLVIEAAGIEDLAEIGGALAGLEVTVLLPPDMSATEGGPSSFSGPPPGVSLGVSLVASRGDDGAGDPRGPLEAFRKTIVGLSGVEPAFARIEPRPGMDLRGLLKQTSYTCFLDGSGFNRFGDEPHVLRLLDATGAVTGNRDGRRLAMYMGLFKGHYYLWPAAAAMRLAGKGSRES